MEEQELLVRLDSVKYSEGVLLVCELLRLRRSGHKDKLESTESEETRGRSKECRDLLKLLG